MCFFGKAAIIFYKAEMLNLLGFAPQGKASYGIVFMAPYSKPTNYATKE